jgi:hypothetical protein
MNVKIIMDQSPSPHNKKLLSFLITNVKDYRSNLRMSIITIPKSQHKTLDAKITALPAAYIGSNVVIGCKKIIVSITTAFNQSKLHVNDDPIQSFWDKSFKNGLGEVSKAPSDSDALASRFTEVTKKRSSAFAVRAPRFKNAPPKSTDNKKQGSQGSSETFIDDDDDMDANTHDKKKVSEVDSNSINDVADLALTTETDPHMRQFWANQFETQV